MCFIVSPIVNVFYIFPFCRFKQLHNHYCIFCHCLAIQLKENGLVTVAMFILVGPKFQSWYNVVNICVMEINVLKVQLVYSLLFYMFVLSKTGVSMFTHSSSLLQTLYKVGIVKLCQHFYPWWRRPAQLCLQVFPFTQL